MRWLPTIPGPQELTRLRGCLERIDQAEKLLQDCDYDFEACIGNKWRLDEAGKAIAIARHVAARRLAQLEGTLRPKRCQCDEEDD